MHEYYSVQTKNYEPFYNGNKSNNTKKHNPNSNNIKKSNHKNENKRDRKIMVGGMINGENMLRRKERKKREDKGGKKRKKEKEIEKRGVRQKEIKTSGRKSSLKLLIYL